MLNRLYANHPETKKVVDAMSAGAEETILNIPRTDKLHRGSADTLYNRVIIEFEKDLRKTLAHAKEQLAGYLLGQFAMGEGYNFILIASDFITWKVSVPDVAQIEQLDTLKEHELNLVERESSSFTLTDKNSEDFYYWIDRILFKEQKSKATLKRMEEAFGYQSTVFIESFRELNKHFYEAKKLAKYRFRLSNGISF